MFRSPTRLRIFRVAALLVASGVVHWLSFLALPRLATSSGPSVEQPIMMTIETSAPADAVASIAATEPRRSEAAPAIATPNHARSAPARAAVAMPTQDVAPETAIETTPTPAASAEAPPSPVVEAPTKAEPSIDLDPRRVALSVLAPSAAESAANASPETRDQLAARRGVELSAELHASANAAPNREHRPPQLERDPDGTCHYAGDAIAATILPDGGVRFDDKPMRVTASSLQPLAPGEILPRGGVPMPPEHPVTPEEMVPAQRLELRARVGGRAWQAEREWFLRNTEGLRRELADAAHERDLSNSEHALRKQLDQIWCNAALPAAERRGAIFALWNDTSSDEVGMRGRRAILAYVRENLPKDSPLAYPAQQLAALNLKRTQHNKFDPYGTLAPREASERESR